MYSEFSPFNNGLFTVNYVKDIIPNPKHLPPRCLVLGLPGSYDTPLRFTSTPIPLSEMMGLICMHKSLYSPQLSLIQLGKPISYVNDIHFYATEDSLYGEGKIIKYPQEINEEEILVAFSAIVYSKGTIQAKKIRIDLNKQAIITFDDEAFMFDECWVAISHNQLSLLTYEVELVKLTTCDHFMLSNKSDGYKEIHNVYLKSKIPLDSIKKCREEMYVDRSEFVIVPCNEVKIKVPKYLKYLFGNHSCVFHHEGFSTESKGYHDVDPKSFELLVQWLLRLVVEQEYPSTDMIIKHDTDVKQWLYVSHYFDIPCFFEYFSLIEKALKNI